ncbi:MAG: CRISPR-associated protein Cas4 [Bacteroidota bacterium]|jgi:CRISPR-associated exonuclease Cas4
MISLTPSLIIEHLYCARYTFYEQVLKVPQYEEKFYKVLKGRELHDRKLEENKPYLRRKIGAVEKWVDQYMTNEFIRGRLDEVLLLSDGTMTPLDYKFAEYDDKVHITYEIQLYCYAWLIEENFQKPVHKGFLVYTRSKNKLVEVPIPPDAKELVKRAAVEIMEIIEHNKYPKGTRQKKKCETCTFRNFCPK